MNVQYLHGFTRDLVEQPIRISNERNRADHRPLHDRFRALPANIQRVPLIVVHSLNA